MKTILAFLLLSSTAFAKSPYALNDKALLGSYEATDKKSTDVGASLAYNDEGHLTAYLLLPDYEHELVLEAPDKNGVVYDSEEEFNCEDSSCGGVSYIKITLQKGKSGDGKTVPQLLIEYTETWPDEEASDEQGELIMEDTDYKVTLIWANDDGAEIPPVRGLPGVSSDLEKLLKACRQAVEDSPLHVLSQSVCPVEDAYVWDSAMDFEEAWPLVLALNSFDKTAKKTTLNNLKRGFFKELRKEIVDAGKYKNQNPDLLLEQVDAMEKFLKARADAGGLIYLGSGGYGAAQLFLVNEKQQSVETLWYGGF